MLNKQKQMAERILTGKQDKIDPEKRKEIRQQRLGARVEFENFQMRSGSGNNYELIYPSLFEEDKNAKYKALLVKANDIWDEFTTGAKGKKRAVEMAEENKRAELQAKKQMHMKKKKNEKHGGAVSKLGPGAIARRGGDQKA